MMGVDEFERSTHRGAENKFVIMDAGSYSITYYNQEVQDAVLGLPDKLAARTPQRLETVCSSFG